MYVRLQIEKDMFTDKPGPSFPQLLMLDSGASLSGCSIKFARNFPHYDIEPMTVSGVTGQTTVSKSIRFFCIFNGKRYKQQVYIIPSLKRDLIFGNDFLLQHGTHINYLTKQIHIHGEIFKMFLSEEEADESVPSPSIREPNVPIPLDELNHLEAFNHSSELPCDPIPVRVKHTFTLGPKGYEKVPVKVSLKKCFNPAAPHLFEFTPNFLLKHEVMGPGLLAYPSDFNFLILSGLGNPQTLYQDEIVGHLCPISDMYSVQSPPSSTNSMHLSTTRPAPPSPPQVSVPMSDEQLESLKFADDLTDQKSTKNPNFVIF